MKFLLDKKEQFTLFQLLEPSLDARNASQFKSEMVVLNAEGIKSLVLDLSEVKTLDATGVGALLLADRLCTDDKGVLVLLGVSDDLQKSLDSHNVSGAFNILNRMEEAVDLVFLTEIEAQLGSEEEGV